MLVYEELKMALVRVDGDLQLKDLAHSYDHMKHLREWLCERDVSRWREERKEYRVGGSRLRFSGLKVMLVMYLN